MEDAETQQREDAPDGPATSALGASAQSPGLKQRVLLLLPVLASLVVAPRGLAAPLDEEAILKRVTAAIDRGIFYIAKMQNPDGSWSCGYGRNNAINGLALLAMMGRGHVPDRGPYLQVLQRGKDFILATQQPNGMFASPNSSHGPMYEQALSTLAMVEMLGMTEDPKLEPATRKAVEIIVKSQSPQGGWRYQPMPREADISVTVMEIVTLRAAQNAGLAVPQETLDRAIRYVESCATPEGGFAYQPGQGPGIARTAAGILSLQLAGRPESEMVTKALDYLATHPIRWGGQYFYYTHYYAIQAQFQAGGASWNRWHPQIREVLLKNQNPDGSWNTPPGDSEATSNGTEKIFSTAMSCLVLEIYLHFLPAYQR